MQRYDHLFFLPLSYRKRVFDEVGEVTSAMVDLHCFLIAWSKLLAS